jgi:carboxypeptidase D
MNGLMNEIGPFRVGAGRTIEDNSKYAWSQVADYFFVDQPVGVGYSTAEDKGYGELK